MTALRIATRASKLAVAQAAWVADALSKSHPTLRVELVEVDTTGDIDRVSPVATLTEVGAFVRSVQHAVLDGLADIAVHSCKDLPVHGPEELAMVLPVREVAWDVLCGSSIEQLHTGARVGTGSPRRAAQLSLLRPDVAVEEIRGNVDTRLHKVESGEFDAVVLAEAGLIRIGRVDAITQRFSLEQMVPAAAQAALAVEVRRNSPVEDLVRVLDDATTRRAVETERLVLERTGAGCRAALGVFADIDHDLISVTGFVADDDGPRRGHAVASSPEAAAIALIAELGLGG